MNIEQLIIYFIVPALDQLGYTTKLHQQFLTPNAVQLEVVTAAPESDMCRYVEQKGAGHAMGWWQHELETANDLYDNWLPAYPQIEEKLADLMLPAFNGSVEQNLLSNPIYAAAMCRLQYFRHPEALPPLNDMGGMYMYYKKYWNSYKGATTAQRFRDDWHKYRIDKYDYPKLIAEGLRLLMDKIL